MRRYWPLAALLLIFGAGSMPGCSCSGGNRIVPDGGYGDAGVNTILVDPREVTLDLFSGTAPPQQRFRVIYHGPDSDSDVTANSYFTFLDSTLGTMSGPVFSSGTDHGGTGTLVVTYVKNMMTLTTQATIHVRIHGSFSQDCVGCPTFPPDTAPACSGTAGSATLVYPPNGVLLPPNMNVIEFQYLPGAGTMLYEIDFKNPATDVRVTTRCSATTDSRGTSSGGCQLDLAQATWSFIAQSNRGGDLVTVSVRATVDGSCVFAPVNSRTIGFGEQDLVGALYYWQSVVNGTVAGRTGGIYRKDFGNTTAPAELIYGPGDGTGTSLNVCIGCHALSRDGKKMGFNSDDSDADDEYSDMNIGIFDVQAKTAVGGYGQPGAQPPGFQTFTNDHSRYLSTDGTGARPGGVFYLRDGNNPYGLISTPTISSSRVTQPDWSADNQKIVFVQPNSFVTWPNYQRSGFHREDTHIAGGSLYVMSNMGADMFSSAVPLVTSTSDQVNNYYPSFSPDGNWVAFNRVSLPGPAGSDADRDSFNNPGARVFMVSSAPGDTPHDLVRANDTGLYTNSWPRFSPFVQRYRGAVMYWVTFSSTRDYGLRVRNHVQVDDGTGTGTLIDQTNCYPPDTPEVICPAGINCHCVGGGACALLDPKCNQPQLWMAAIVLQSGEGLPIADPSFPAFWLPFQEIKAHNHIAQWTAGVAGQTPPDGGIIF